MRSSKGFSKLELVIVLLVVSILLAVFLPRIIRYAQESPGEVCSVNRATILRLYQAHKLLDPDCPLSDVLDGSCPDFEDDTDGYVCPNGGTYTAVGNERIHCSRHGD